MRIKINRYHNKINIIIAAILILVIVITIVIFCNIPKNVTKKSNNQTNSSSSSKKQNSDTTVNTQGGAIDKNGNANVSNPQNQWTISTSGLISLRQPIKNSTIKSGDEISGAATVDEIQYRLVDDAIGVISQGRLSVVNGLFAGSLQFHPKGNTGSLVVYSFDEKGREINEIEIPVKI